MKIDRIHLDRFGKFCDKDLEFSKGLNIIYGNNEAGKTTLHTAIKTIFYPLTAKSKENQEKICFIPANEKKAEWTVDFTTDGGRQYTSCFSMGKTKRGCTQKTVEKSLGTEWKTADLCLGEALFQMPEEMFDNLAYMKDKTLTEMRNAPLVNRQLAMFSQQNSEQEELDAVKKINAAISLIERKNNRLDKLEQNRRELLEKKRELRDKEAEYNTLKAQMASVEREQEEEKKEITKLLRLIDEVETYDKYEKMKAAEALQKQMIKNEEMLKELDDKQKQMSYLKGLSLDQISKCEALERELSEYGQDKQQTELHVPAASDGKSRLYMRLLAIQLAVSAVFGVLILWKPFLFSILTGIGLILSGFFCYKYRQYKRLCSQQRQKQKEEQVHRIQAIRSQRDELLGQFQCRDAKELHDKYLSYQEQLHRRELLELSLENDRRLFDTNTDKEEFVLWQQQFSEKPPEKRTEDLKELIRQKDMAEARLNERNVAYANLSGKTLNYKGDLELRIRLEEELSAAEAEINSLTHRLDVLKKTRGYMERAKENLKTGYLPKLNAEVKQILGDMGLPHVEQIYVDEMLNISVKADNQNFLKSGLQLSMGTRDQMYFALRLAVCRLAYAEGEKIPLFLDDPFVRLDDERFRQMMNYLNSCRDMQILYFTCHRRALQESLGGKVIQL